MLTSLSYNAVRGYGADIGNLRVSGTAIELDLLLKTQDNLQAATRALESKLGSILTVRQLDTTTAPKDTDAAIREGIDFFNEERYWESHESLEFAWRKATGPDRELLQGIILVAAALVHSQKNENTVALSVLGRAREKLSGSEGERFGVNIDSLRENVSRMINEGRIEYFKIQWARSTNEAAA